MSTLRPPDVTHVINDTMQALHVIHYSSASVYYFQRKPKNRKKQGRAGNEAKVGWVCE